MAFDFNGTFTASQFARFDIYLRNQVALIDERILHLEAEKDRIGNLSFGFDSEGVPTEVSSGTKGNPPPPTYIGKLFGSYETLGGDAEFDLQVRSTGQAVYRLTGDETQTPQRMSNGEVIGTSGLSDAETTDRVQQLRSWVQDDLDRRKNFLERKIRRATDYAEQLQLEINELRTIQADITVNGALEFLLQSVKTFIADPNYLAATNDSGKADPHGKRAKAPIAAYTPGGDGLPASETFSRTSKGPVAPGEST